MNLDQQIAEDLEKIEDGFRDSLPIIIKWRRMQKMLEEAIEQVKETAMVELSRYPKSTTEIDGAKLEVRATAGRWDFKNIAEWDCIEADKKEIEARAKQAYQMKSKGMEAIDETTGEVIEAADYTAGKDTIFIKL